MPEVKPVAESVIALPGHPALEVIAAKPAFGVPEQGKAGTKSTQPIKARGVFANNVDDALVAPPKLMLVPDIILHPLLVFVYVPAATVEYLKFPVMLDDELAALIQIA